MTWHSIGAMTVIDLLIVGTVGLACTHVVATRKRFVEAHVRRGLVVIALGLALVGLFHLADLVVMHLLPLFVPRADALQAMQAMHLNWRWLVALAGVGAVSLGLLMACRSVVILIERLEGSRRDLRGELEARRESERALRDSRVQLAHSQRIAGVGSYEWDIAADAISWTDETYRIWGRGPGQTPPGKDDVVRAVHADDRERVGTEIEAALEGQAPYDTQFRILRPDGSERIVRDVAEVIRDADGRPVLWRGAVQDITDKALAERELAEKTSLLDGLVRNSVAIITIKDPDQRYLLVNPEFERAFGVTSDEALGKTPFDIFPRKAAELWQRQDDESSEQNRVFVHENRVQLNDGSTHVYLSAKFPIQTADGKTSAIATIATDITEQKETEARVRALNERLERRVEERTAELRAAQEELVRKERLAALGQLTGTVSHELRNPLGALRASIATIRKLAGVDQPMLRSAVEIIDRSITRCDNIIGDLLDYSRGETLAPEATNLGPWLEALLDEYTTPPNVAVRREIDPDLEITIDRERLRRVLTNVIDNACQAMAQDPAGNGPAPGGTLSVAARRNGARLEIEVADTGPGIAADHIGRIFEPLFSTKSFGVGLGLAIVRRIMESHGGGVEVASEPGRGARFVLWLPYYPEFRQPASRAEDPAARARPE